MDDQTKLLLDQIPDRTFRSKLEPYRELILALRRKRRTYREIAILLRDHFNLSVHHSTIQAFVKVRARSSDHKRLDSAFSEITQTIKSHGPSNGEIYARMEALKQKEKLSGNTTTNAKPKFHYGGEPLRLIDPNFNKKD